MNHPMQRLFVAASMVSFAGFSFAQVTNVDTGLTYSTISAAITAASPGHTISIGAGTFNENLVINKWITLDGAGDSTVIAPATGAPMIVTAGGASAANRSIIRDLRIETADAGILSAVSVRGDVTDIRFDNISLNWLGGLNWTPQVEGFGFRSSSNDITSWTSGTPADHRRIDILNSRIRNFYVAAIFYENANNVRFENNIVTGGWFGFQRLNMNQNGPASVSNRSTDTITLRGNTFFDQGVKGAYLEAGNNLTIESNQFLFGGNRSGDSLPTSDPRGLAGARAGAGLDLNFNNAGEQQNVRILNNVFIGNAIRDRIPGDPGGPALGIGSAVAIKGRMFRGATFINGLDIVGNTFTGNKIALAFPEVDTARTAPVVAVPGTNAGNRIINARIVGNNFFGNRTRGINGEGSSAGTGNLVFATPQNVAIIAGGPNEATPTTWNNLAFGTSGFYVADNYFGSANGPANLSAVLSPSLPPAGTGDAVSPFLPISAPFIASRLATPFGRPIDLAGSYNAPSSVFTSPSTSDAVGIANASTGTAGLITAQVSEVSGGLGPASIGTFTPFNASPKLPRMASIPSGVAVGTTINTVVNLGGDWLSWRWGGSFGATHATGDTFGVGIGNQFQTMGVQFVRDHISGNFRARMSSTNLTPRTGLGDGSAVVGSLAGNEDAAFGAPEANTPAAGFSGSTRFMVTMVIGANSMRGFVTPLNGPSAGRAVDLGTISKTNMNTNHPWTPFTTGVSSFFVAGFNTYNNRQSDAQAEIESFTATVGENAHYAWADDAYVTGSELIRYRTGMANLVSKVYGYQGSYVSSGNQSSPFSFSRLIYPFNQALFNPAIGNLNYAAGLAFDPLNLDGTDADLSMATMTFTPSVMTGGIASLSPQGTFLGALQAYYSDINGDALSGPALVESNQVVVDSTAPTVNPVSLTLNPTSPSPVSIPFAPVNPILVDGTYRLVMNTFDGGSIPSGLYERATYEWDFGNNGTIDLSGRLRSGTGSNFFADFTIPASATNGTAKLTVCATDRSGNQTCNVKTFTLNTNSITINFSVPSGWAGQTLWVHARVGGNGSGSNTALDYHRPVVIGAGGSGQLVLNALNTSGATALPIMPNGIDRFSLKVMPYSLRVNGSLSGSATKVGNAGSLRFGDANGNNIIDVLDYGFFIGQYFQTQTAAPVALLDGQAPTDPSNLPLASRRADFDGSGTVDTGDFSFFLPFGVVGNLLTSGPGNFNRPPTPQMTMTVREAVLECRIPHNVVSRLDVDRDGILTFRELQGWRPGM